MAAHPPVNVNPGPCLLQCLDPPLAAVDKKGSSLVSRPSPLSRFTVYENGWGRARKFDHVGDVSVYLGRQWGGGFQTVLKSFLTNTGVLNINGTQILLPIVQDEECMHQMWWNAIGIPLSTKVDIDIIHMIKSHRPSSPLFLHTVSEQGRKPRNKATRAVL